MQVSSLFAVFALFCLFSGCVCRFVVTSSNASYICKHAPDSDSGCVRLSDVASEIESRANSSRANASNIIKIYVWVMVPFEDGYIFSKNHVQAAVYRALNDSGAELCGNGTEYKNDTCFEVSFNDTRCDADYVINKVVDIQDEFILQSDQCTGNIEQNSSEKIPIFLGMTCDLTAGRVGALSTHWNWTDIFPGTRTVTFDDKTTSSDMAMVRPGHTASDVGRFVTKLYQRYNWTKTDVVYTSKNNHGAPVHDDVISDCSTLMSGITTQFRNTLKWTSNDQYTIRSYSDDNALMAGAKKLLNQLKDNGRSSVWCVGRKVMRYIMNIAEEMDMANGDFSFLYLDLYNTNTSYSWSDVDDQDFYPEVNVTMGDSIEPLRALQVISLYQPETSEYKDFSDEMKTEIRKLSGGSISENGEFVNPFVPEYYNAIRLLVKGLERSSADGDFIDGRDFARKMWNTSFDSVDGVVTISEKGDRLMDYVLMDLNTETKKFEVALIYFGRNGSWDNITKIDWPGTKVPHITNQLSNPDTNAIEIVISVAVVIILFFLLTVLYVLRRLNREKNLRKMKWKVYERDLQRHERKRADSYSGESTTTRSSGKSESSAIFGRQLFTTTVRWNDNTVAYKELGHIARIHVDHKVMVELQQMLLVENQHVCKFLGASVDQPVFILNEYCSRGSLQDILEDSADWDMDDVFRNSLISDIAHGMHYLHRSPINSHGNLKSSNCLVDSRFVVKIADFGLPSFRKKGRKDSENEYSSYKNMLWTAPELLRHPDPPILGTQKGDIYSFGIICQEILYMKGVFYMGASAEDHQPKDIYSFVVTPPHPEEFFRPFLEDDDEVIVGGARRHMVRMCWQESPEARPTFNEVLHVIRRVHREKNLVDSLLKRLEQHAHHLEDKVEERTAQYKSEKERADTLLYQMLPKSVADRLKKGQSALPESFDRVTIYFSDIVGFTALSHDSTPIQVVEMLNDLYTKFDNVIDGFQVYKVETIGDAYMVVSGLPERNGNEHACEIARMALGLLEAVETFTIRHMPSTRMQLRIGIHSGPVVAGVVGRKMPRYCLFGDTVNTAARMEQNGKPLKIHVSPLTKEILDEYGSFHFEQREEKVFLKGLGNWTTWWLEGEQSSLPNIADSFKIPAQDVSPKISGSSGYSTTSSNLLDSELGDPRRSVTGVYPEDTEINGARTVVFTIEPETERYPRVTQAPGRKPLNSSSSVTGIKQSGDETCSNAMSIHSSGESIKSPGGKREKRRRTGSIEGRPADLQAELPELQKQQEKRLSGGLPPAQNKTEKDAMTNGVRNMDSKRSKHGATKVKFASDVAKKSNQGKKKFSPFRRANFGSEHRDSGLGITYENTVFHSTSDDENTIL